jgi:hypothetical protein
VAPSFASSKSLTASFKTTLPVAAFRMPTRIDLGRRPARGPV